MPKKTTEQISPRVTAVGDVVESEFGPEVVRGVEVVLQLANGRNVVYQRDEPVDRVLDPNPTLAAVVALMEAGEPVGKLVAAKDALQSDAVAAAAILALISGDRPDQALVDAVLSKIETEEISSQQMMALVGAMPVETLVEATPLDKHLEAVMVAIGANNLSEDQVKELNTATKNKLPEEKEVVDA